MALRILIKKRLTDGVLPSGSEVTVKHIYILSDSTGETAERVMRAAMSQYTDTEVKIIRLAKLTSSEEINAALETVATHDSILAYTLVDASLVSAVQEKAQELGIVSYDLLTPLMCILSTFLGKSPRSTPGLLHQIDTDYFRRMEAVNFTVKHDDGQETRGLVKADLILVGVSRSSKTPLSMYLANKGYKVANVPLVKGIEPPPELDGIDPKKVIGLLISPKRLVEIRTSRLVTMGQSTRSSYADYEAVEEEIAFCRQFYRRHPDWIVIDVTTRSVEETASEILRRIGGE